MTRVCSCAQFCVIFVPKSRRLDIKKEKGVKYSYDPSGNLMRGERPWLSADSQATGRASCRAGQIATFSVVVADARAVTFQWKFNGADIPGATGDSLLLTNVSAANEGQYSVVVTNSAGSVTSAPAALMLDSDRDGLPDSWEIAALRQHQQASAAKATRMRWHIEPRRVPRRYRPHKRLRPCGHG